ncbi:hypothetical protein PSACC_03052, partial [Paramicrosporidium saccamoebae]
MRGENVTLPFASVSELRPLGGTASVELAEKVLSASSGAVITSLVVTPLDVIKVRMQAPASASVSSPYVFCSRFYDHVGPCNCRTLYVFDRPVPRLSITGTLDGVVKITQHEGLGGLWRGLSPTLLMAIPATIVYFVGYESIRESLKKLPVISQQPNIHHWAVPLLAGSTARIIAVTMISPIELLKTKMQHRGKDGGVIPVAREILSSVRNHGPGALYRGLIPTLWRDVPFSALYWAGYENFKSIFRRNIHLRDSASNNFLVSFMAGASSGMIAASLTTPFDVAKTRQQVALYRDASHVPKSIGSHLMEIWRTEGFAGLTR